MCRQIEVSRNVLVKELAVRPLSEAAKLSRSPETDLVASLLATLEEG